MVRNMCLPITVGMTLVYCMPRDHVPGCVGMDADTQVVGRVIGVVP